MATSPTLALWLDSVYPCKYSAVGFDLEKPRCDRILAESLILNVTFWSRLEMIERGISDTASQWSKVITKHRVLTNTTSG